MAARVDELQVAGLTLRGVSCGGVLTSLMVPEFGLLFDVGGSVPGQLRYSTVLVSHGHQDHLGALLYLVSQRHLARLSPPRVHVPREIVAPLRRIVDAWSEIEGFQLEIELEGHEPGDRVVLDKGLEALAIRSIHRVPSLAWLIERTTHKLLPDYRGLSGEELKRLRAGGTIVTQASVTGALVVSGDTRIELFARDERVQQAKVVVYEVTSWDASRSVEQIRDWGHTHVDEMIEHAEKFRGEALVLVHRSPRHTRKEAEEIVQTRFPVSVRDRIHVFGR